MTQAEISKLISTMWRAAPVEVRSGYEQRAEAEKLAHREKYPDYKYKPMKREEKIRLREEEKARKKARKSSRDNSPPQTSPSTSSPASASAPTPPDTFPPLSLAIAPAVAVPDAASNIFGDLSLYPMNGSKQLPQPFDEGPLTASSVNGFDALDSHGNYSWLSDAFASNALSSTGQNTDFLSGGPDVPNNDVRTSPPFASCNLIVPVHDV